MRAFTISRLLGENRIFNTTPLQVVVNVLRVKCEDALVLADFGPHLIDLIHDSR